MPEPGVHATAVIGEPPEYRDWKAGDEKHHPIIDPRARISAFVTIDAGVKHPTYVGESFVMAHCHIGHDAFIGDGCELAPGTVVGGWAKLMDGVKCGIGALIRPEVVIGENARIGMGAVVTKDVSPGDTVVGNPAKPTRQPECARRGY